MNDIKRKEIPNLVVENAKIIFRNFSGAQTKYNHEGNRNFSILFYDQELVENLKRDGWNIKERPPRDEDDDMAWSLQIKVAFGVRPPAIWLVTKNGKQNLNEQTVGLLDMAEIETVDLTARPYQWEVNGKTGVSAYLQSMYVTIVEDEFADKYRDKPAD